MFYRFLRPVALLLFAVGPALSAVAADAAPSHLQTVPEIPPPPGVSSDSAWEPQITIVQRGEDRLEEYRVRGKLYMIKVTPPHGTPYFLFDPNGQGQFQRLNEITPNLLVPLWVLFSF